MAIEQEVTTGMKTELFETKRDQAIRRVMQSLPGIVATGALISDKHDAPRLVMLPDDTVGYLSEALARVGGTANVVIAFPEKILLMTVTPGVLDDNHVDANAHADMQMLVDWIGAVPDSTASFSVNAKTAHPLPVQQLTYA